MNLQELSANKDSGSRELQSYREKELNLFKEQGLSLNPEDYKFTNLPKFFEDLPKTEVASGETVISPDSDLITFRFLDGVFQTPHKIEGVIITPVSDKFEEVKELLVSQNALNHLHHGLLDHGLFLEVQKLQSHGPIRIQHIITKNTIKCPHSYYQNEGPLRDVSYGRVQWNTLLLC